jgi:hypothetical protein
MILEAVAVETNETAVGVEDEPEILASAVAVAMVGRSVKAIAVPVGIFVVGDSFRKFDIIYNLS